MSGAGRSDRSGTIDVTSFAGPGAETAPDLEALLEELRIQQAELEVQNEELRYTQLALERSRDRYFHLFDQAPVSYLILSPSTAVLEANQSAAELLGRSRTLLRGTTFTSFLSLDSLEEGRALVAGAFRTNERRSAELSLRTTRGRRTVAHVELAAMVDEDGQHVMLATLIDVTRRLEAQAERELLEEKLRQAQKMEAVGTLAGGVAHDMNNVLGAIVGMASAALAEGQSEATMRTDLERILQAAERGADLTRNLLGFARKGKFREEPIELGALLERVTAVLRRTLSRNVHIDVQVDPQLPAVLGDASQLSHAVMNLCLNAVDAMDGVGRIVVTAERTQVEPGEADGFPDVVPGTYALLRVVDTGRGMEPAVRDRAFEPFFTTKPPGEGTGLGLAMVYGTVHSHGGTVRIDSEVGRGTAVEIRLPVTRRRPGRVSSTTPPPPPESAVTGLVILVVDDEPDVRRATRRLLDTLGHRALTAESGREALEVLRGPEPVDLVLLDMIMPDMDGEATLTALLTERPSTRVVICSGYSRNDRVEAMLARGAVGFLQKPFGRDGLRNAIERARAVQ